MSRVCDESRRTKLTESHTAEKGPQRKPSIGSTREGATRPLPTLFRHDPSRSPRTPCQRHRRAA
eukprot:4227821-Prymnesium_polylepis.2